MTCLISPVADFKSQSLLALVPDWGARGKGWAAAVSGNNSAAGLQVNVNAISTASIWRIRMDIGTVFLLKRGTIEVLLLWNVDTVVLLRMELLRISSPAEC